MRTGGICIKYRELFSKLPPHLPLLSDPAFLNIGLRTLSFGMLMCKGTWSEQHKVQRGNSHSAHLTSSQAMLLPLGLQATLQVERLHNTSEARCQQVLRETERPRGKRSFRKNYFSSNKYLKLQGRSVTCIKMLKGFMENKRGFRSKNFGENLHWVKGVSLLQDFSVPLRCKSDHVTLLSG